MAGAGAGTEDAFSEAAEKVIVDEDKPVSSSTGAGFGIDPLGIDDDEAPIAEDEEDINDGEA